MDSSHRIICLVTAAAAFAAAAGLAGCARPAQEVTVVQAPDTRQTPLERGALRTQALDGAKAAWDVWVRNDVEGMRSHFGTDTVDYYKALYARYASEGRQRVRKYDVLKFDVTEMNESGTQAIVDGSVRDLSYFVDRSGGRTKPTGKKATLQWTLERQKDGKWIVVRTYMDAPIKN